MKKPFIRVTKWLGDIPLEAVKFQVRPTSHRPSREEYQKALQREFDPIISRQSISRGMPVETQQDREIRVARAPPPAAF